MLDEQLSLDVMLTQFTDQPLLFLIVFFMEIATAKAEATTRATTHTRTCTHMRMCMHAHVHAHVQVHAHVYTPMCTHTHTRAHVHTHARMRTHVCTHTRTHARKHLKVILYCEISFCLVCKSLAIITKSETQRFKCMSLTTHMQI